jgi:HAD superfamily hydrolase (TIGR01509 family)
MQAVIFDIDGTLIDSVDLHAKAWKDALEHFGYEFTFDKIRGQIGKGGDQLLPFLLNGEEAEAKGREIEKCRSDLFKKQYLAQVKPFPGVRDLFQRFLKEGWKIALASSAKGDELQTYKKTAGIDDLLDTETSSDDADKSKPHPDIFLAALEHLGDMRPEDCLIVGDSPYDAEAAAKASIRAIGVLCGGFELDELQKAGYEDIFRDPTDMLQNFDKIVRLATQ